MPHVTPTVIDFVAGDTEPFPILLPGVNITGWEIKLHIGYLPIPLVKTGTIITASPNGRAEISFSSGDLLPGQFSAEIQITKPGPFVLTSAVFIANIRRQVA